MEIKVEQKSGNNYYAIIAGLCASSASFFGKLPSSILTFHELKVNQNNSNLLTHFMNEIGILEQIHIIWIIRIVSISLMIICNALVWRFYVKALHNKGGTLVATLISASSNYCFSAALGCFLFNEKTSMLWWLGTFIVLVGLVLIIMDDNNKIKEK